MIQRKKNDNKLIILQNAKFYWSVPVINQAKGLFEKGFKPSQVAEIMNEKVIDIGLVYLHLLETKQLRR